MKILITGPQASGKTTQAKAIASKLKLCFVDSGDLIRGFSKIEGEKNLQVKEALRDGQLIDNQVAADIVRERLLEADCQNGAVLDGYPRSIEQLKVFDPGFDRVFYLEVPDEVAVQRALRRGRVDDNPEIIRERLRIYHLKTEEIIKYFQDKGVLVKIDGSIYPEEVTEKIMENLKS
jgi:adenylate kinase